MVTVVFLALSLWNVAELSLRGIEPVTVTSFVVTSPKPTTKTLQLPCFDMVALWPSRSQKMIVGDDSSVSVRPIFVALFYFYFFFFRISHSSPLFQSLIPFQLRPLNILPMQFLPSILASVSRSLTRFPP